MSIDAYNAAPGAQQSEDLNRVTPDDAAGVLAQAKRLVADGKDDEAEASFRRLLSHDGYRAEGNYGVGYVSLRRGAADVAELMFHRAVADDPRHANAAYQLGRMAEQRGFVDEAREWYDHALAGNPEHVGAQQRLVTLGRPVAQQPVASAQPVVTAQPAPTEQPASTAQRADTEKIEPDRMTASSYGVYEYLLADQSPLSRETIASMDALHTSTHPRFTAYLGRHLAKLALLLAAPLALLSALAAADIPGPVAKQLGPDVARRLSDTAHGLQFIVVLIVLGVVAIGYVRVKTTKITISRGRLQIHKGILARRVSNIELWRVQSIELDRTIANRLTGDGTLMIELSGTATSSLRRRGRRKPSTGDVLKVTGLTRGRQLDATFQQLLNLVFLLRANPIVKGIIQ